MFLYIFWSELFQLKMVKLRLSQLLGEFFAGMDGTMSDEATLQIHFK